MAQAKGHEPVEKICIFPASSGEAGVFPACFIVNGGVAVSLSELLIQVCVSLALVSLSSLADVGGGHRPGQGAGRTV